MSVVKLFRRFELTIGNRPDERCDVIVALFQSELIVLQSFDHDGGYEIFVLFQNEMTVFQSFDLD